MNFESFGCERQFIDGVYRDVQRNILIQEYCGDNFTFINLVDFYYRHTSKNAILMFLFISLVYPILFLCVAAIADKYLSIGMQDLSQRFKLSPTLAAVTLIAFANGAPDILSSLSSSGKEGGAYISLGALFGGFIFSATLVVSNVVLSSKGQEVQMPKLPVLKELGFYFASVLIVIIFGLLQFAGYPFVIAYLLTYALYIFTTLYIEKKEGDKPDQDLEAGFDAAEEEDDNNDLIVNQSRAFETNVSIQDSDVQDDKPKGFLGEIMGELNDEESSSLENAILMPLMAAGMLTVCYLDNPFMKKPTRPLIIGTSIFFTFYILELLPFSLVTLLLIGYGVGLVTFILEKVGVNKNTLEIVYEFTSVFAAIAWISIFSGIIIDFITFLAFYFSINEVILSSLLLSAGNTIGDFFGNAALAKAGESVMGAFASYSGQIFNNFIGFAATILSSALSGKNDFNIFAIGYYDGVGAESKPAPLGQYFLIWVIFNVVFVIGLSASYYFMNNFLFTKKFTNILIGVYTVFFSASMIFGFLSRA